jgi:hypothetical protein
MWVCRFWGENHEVRDVDHANAQGRLERAEELDGFEDFEGDFDADADEDDVGIFPVVSGGELPDTRPDAAVFGGVGGGEVHGSGLL